MTHSLATLANFGDLLSSHEHSEIRSFPDIYFAGAAHVQKIGSSSRPTGAHGADKLNLVKTVDPESLVDVFNQGARRVLILQALMIPAETTFSQNMITLVTATKYSLSWEKGPLDKS